MIAAIEFGALHRSPPLLALGSLGALALAASLGSTQVPDVPSSRSPVVQTVAPPLPSAGTAAPAAQTLTPDEIAGISLKGTLRNGRRASAIIESDGRQRRVGLGAMLLPGIRLVKVSVGAIVVERGGGQVRLPLARFAGTAMAAAVATPTPAPVTNTASNAPVGTVSRADYGGDAMQLQTMRFQLGLAKVKSGEQVVGFRIRRVASMPLFAAAGLHDGDVVVSLNGNGLNDDEKVIELAEEVAQSKHLRIAYLRRGVPETAVIDLVD